MALRAGYYGLKNTVKKKLEKLAADTSGMKIIKTIGDGLNLTNAGKLNVTAATADKLGGIKVGSGLEIANGVLSATGSDLTSDLLYNTAAATSGEATLAHDVKDYKFLLFTFKFSTTSAEMCILIPAQLFITLYPWADALPTSATKHLVICIYSSTQFARVSMGSADNKIAINNETGGFVKDIYGIK